MPKCDLHCHLDGSMRLSTLIELAREFKASLPCMDEEGLIKALHIGLPCDGLDEYLKCFDHTLKVLQEKDALARVAFEVAEDAARENVAYLEVRYSPIFHATRGMTWKETVDAVLSGLARAEAKYPIRARVILTGIRSIPPQISERLAELAVEYKGGGVVGFDLAGSEAHNPAKVHRGAFYIIKKHNVNCTLHAGEAAGRRSIQEALHYCGADRIGQGTRLVEDGDLVNYVNDHRIPIEVCLTSSRQMGEVPDLAQHPFPFFLDYGLRVTLNTDNRLICNTTMTDELLLAAATFNLGKADLVELLIAGFKSAFLPFHEKVKLLEAVLPRLGRKVTDTKR